MLYFITILVFIISFINIYESIELRRKYIHNYSYVKDKKNIIEDIIFWGSFYVLVSFIVYISS